MLSTAAIGACFIVAGDDMGSARTCTGIRFMNNLALGGLNGYAILLAGGVSGPQLNDVIFSGNVSLDNGAGTQSHCVRITNASNRTMSHVHFLGNDLSGFTTGVPHLISHRSWLQERRIWRFCRIRVTTRSRQRHPRPQLRLVRQLPPTYSRLTTSLPVARGLGVGWSFDRRHGVVGRTSSPFSQVRQAAA